MNDKKNKILVAVDGSDQSWDLVHYISKMVSPQNTKVVLFHVMRKINDAFRDVGANPAFHNKVANLSAWQNTHRIMIQEFMDEACQVLIDEGYPRDSVITNIQECEVGIARDIISESNKGYSAVAVGRRGHSRLMDIMMGSVAYKLMEKMAHAPVWIVGGTPSIGKLLIGLDPSEGASQALNHVANVVADTDVQVTLVNVFRFPSSFHSEIDNLPIDIQKEVFARAEEEINPFFDESKRLLIHDGVSEHRISSKFLTGVSSRAGAIVDEAKHGGYGTIVVGRRGVTEVNDFLMGRVSNKVINLARDLAVWIVS